MDNELGPATGEFRVWLDLALARGMTVRCVAFGNELFGPIYQVTDGVSGYDWQVHDAADVERFFRLVARDRLLTRADVIAQLLPGLNKIFDDAYAEYKGKYP